MWSELFINIADSQIEKRPIPEAFKEFGGRSYVTNYLMALVMGGKMDPKCDPMGPQNPLIFCNGIFSGTAFSTDHRLSVGGKSPLTGTIKEASAGGTVAKYMADHGLRSVTVHGLPTDGKLKYIHILPDGSAVLEDAEEYRLMGNYAFGDAMRAKYGKNVAIASIGPAGERLCKAASIQVTEFGEGYPSRAAARGGIGALMGVKGIKALVIEKAENVYKVEYANEELFKQSVAAINKLMHEKGSQSHYHKVGTISIIDGTARNGILPVKNFGGKMMYDAPEKVGAVPFLANNAQRGGCNGKPCQPGCVVQCSNVYNDKDGNYLTSGFEYETVALFGPNCMITDLDQIARLDRMCDDIGLDTIEMGDAAAVAMESGKIEWGDGKAVEGLLNEVKEGTEFGLIMGNGCEAVGLALGCEHIPVVKHQSLSGYDPRNSKGTGITYAKSPQGADHTAACTVGFTSFGDYPRDTALYVSNKLQVAITFSDSMMCLFAFSQISSRLDLLLGMYVGLFGGEMDITRITIGLGVKVLLTEVKFNELAGFKTEDDRLPRFFYEEMHEGTGEVFDIGDIELDSVFRF
ncbi:MAG: aldehyde ferredoxin oxidoreductase [Lachnospiraceae bacterium]|nr:aldehyde ferredoxin oxidoreductase [Lachnospiraceae bacterium]